MSRALHKYSSELKQRLVEEIEQGHLSLREAARDAQTNVTMVQKWLDEYGRFKPKRDVVEVVMKSEQDQIAALQTALAEAHLKLRVYEELIAQANTRYKTDIKKNFGMPPRAPSVESAMAPPSPPSAGRSSARATRTTSASAAPSKPTTRKR